VAGTKSGGNKLKAKMLALNPNYYQDLGRRGGAAKHNKPSGFGAMDKDKHLEAARKGGLAGRRTNKLQDLRGYKEENSNGDSRSRSD